MKLQRFDGNPILSPKPDSWWQCAVTANPGAWYDEASRTVTMLYRASAADVEHKVYLGKAVSGDGLRFDRYVGVATAEFAKLVDWLCDQPV